MKRLNRLTYAFSKKLENLVAAFAMYVAYYNFCWQTRKPGKSGERRYDGEADEPRLEF